MSDLQFRSQIEGLAFPALADSIGMSMLGLQYQFARSQWWSRAALEAQQLRQLQSLLDHAMAHVPYYRDVLPKAGLRAGQELGWSEWRRIPILRRRDVQDHHLALAAERYPELHGRKSVKTSGGSTGQPVNVDTTESAGLIWEAITLRDSHWHRRDLGGTLATLRARARGPVTKDGLRAGAWNRGIGAAYVNGPSLWLSGQAPVAEQVDWLLRICPDYLQAPPTILREVLDETERRRVRLSGLKAVLSYSEQLPPSLRERIAVAWRVPLQDMYSCEEVGYLALQCPDRAHYHVQSEAVLLEVLDEAGAPCRPGATGRVVATPLHNFAMPLIRYEIGDYAEVGPSCRCGRGLPVLARILGRARNMLRFASGRGKFLDLLPLEKRMIGLPIRQYQLTQRDYESIEMSVVADRALAPGEEGELRDLIAGACGATGFTVVVRYRDSIPRSAGGKYEDFVCAVEDG